MVADEINVTTDDTRRTRYISRLSPLLCYLYLVSRSSGSVPLDIGIIAEADARGSFSQKKKGPYTASRMRERAGKKERAGTQERKRVLIRPSYSAIPSEISQLRSPSSLALLQIVRASVFVARTGLPKESKTRQVPHYCGVPGSVLRSRGIGGRNIANVSAARMGTG